MDRIFLNVKFIKKSNVICNKSWIVNGLVIVFLVMILSHQSSLVLLSSCFIVELFHRRVHSFLFSSSSSLVHTHQLCYISLPFSPSLFNVSQHVISNGKNEVVEFPLKLDQQDEYDDDERSISFFCCKYYWEWLSWPTRIYSFSLSLSLHTYYTQHN